MAERERIIQIPNILLSVKFAELASATLKQVADWFVWLASTLCKFFDERSGKAERNANKLRRADHEVHDIAGGRYDGRIQKFQQGLSR